MRLDFTLNNRPYRLEAPDHWTVLDLLRDGLALTATKYGCGEGVCGTCTVLLDDEPVRGCLVLAARLRGRTLLTAEGLESNGAPDHLQSAFARAGAAQCGFCTPGMLEIGAMTSLSALVRDGIVRDGWPLLAHAASRVATPSIRSSATLGGNLCYAEAASDPAPALLCLEAQVRVADSVGERVVPIGEFFTGFYETAVAAGEILTAVRVPPMPEGARAGYVKFCPRSAEDKPLIGVAALVTLDGAGRVSDIRLAL